MRLFYPVQGWRETRSTKTYARIRLIKMAKIPPETFVLFVVSGPTLAPAMIVQKIKKSSTKFRQEIAVCIRANGLHNVHQNRKCEKQTSP